LSLALAYEPSEPGLMRRPPRRPGAPILGEYALWRIIFVSLLIGGATIAVFLLEERNGYSIEMAQTMAVNTLVLGQVFYLFNSRFLKESSFRLDLLFSNPVVWMAIGLLAVLQLLFVYVPFLNFWFHSAPIPFGGWLLPIGIGFAIFLAVEAEKALLRRLKPSTGKGIKKSISP
jgi:magnesium-transporting ATPase (P-type)